MFDEAWENIKNSFIETALMPLLLCTSPSRSTTSADQRSQRFHHHRGTGHLEMGLYEKQEEDILDGSTDW
jgi:hypothetical protein